DLAVNDRDVLASSWRFKGRALLVLGNLSDKEKVLNLQINAEKLALAKGYRIVNAETKAVETADKISLAPYDFKLLILE
ncbi:MAG: hypothetical protein J6R86_03610, partial [Lentisphaeria bacterium]|nr:hypothetical protein [Lentisphaeria bacterium]